MDELLARTKNIDEIKQALGIPKKGWKNIKGLVRLDIPSPFDYDIKLPKEKQMGANEKFKAGGRTSGGMPELSMQQLQGEQLKDVITNPIEINY